ncbi:MAG: hypothetical protein QOF37_2904 [Thermoleophilaceae bacterium]|jgi:hypothetical protein|nr:hypothetical protein [Thermoleophilaceae bacterium]
MADPIKYRRVDIGFQAGAVLSLRVQESDYKALREAMGGDDRWHELPSEDAAVTLDLTQVIYVRLDTERDRVGF